MTGVPTSRIARQAAPRHTATAQTTSAREGRIPRSPSAGRAAAASFSCSARPREPISPRRVPGRGRAKEYVGGKGRRRRLVESVAQTVVRFELALDLQRLFRRGDAGQPAPDCVGAGAGPGGREIPKGGVRGGRGGTAPQIRRWPARLSG